MPLRRRGTDYGGYVYPDPLPLGPDAVLYSFGVGEDLSHDVALAAETGATVHLFDPTPRSAEHVNQVRAVLAKTQEPVPSSRFGGGDPQYWTQILARPVSPSLLAFHDVGLFTECGVRTFYMPTHREYVSGSLSPLGRSTTDTLTVQVSDLATICRELGHPHGPDVLKLDIENLECAVLQQMIHDTPFRPKWLAVDFDLARTGPVGEQEARTTLALLQTEGYSILDNRSWDITLERTI